MRCQCQTDAGLSDTLTGDHISACSSTTETHPVRNGAYCDRTVDIGRGVDTDGGECTAKAGGYHCQC